MGKITNEELNKIKESSAKDLPKEIKTLQKFCKIDCGTRNLEGNKQVVAIVDQELSKLKGVKIIHHESPEFGTAVVGILKSKNAKGKIILNAHLDTVFKPGDCKKHPYKVEGDKAYGLGIVDCKGGVIVSCHAVKLAQELGLLPNSEIVMIYNPDEEVGSPFGQQVFKKYVKGANAAYVFEPARNQDGIITSRKCGMRFHLEVTGVAAHSGVNYLDGRNALVELSSIITRLYQANDDKRGIQFNFGKIDDGGRDLGIIPPYAACEVSVRVGDDKEAQWARKTIEKVISKPFIKGTKTTMKETYLGTPMHKTKESLLVYKNACKAGKLLGLELPQQTTGGGSDASYFMKYGVPAIDALGPHMFKMHSFEESLSIKSLQQRTELFITILAGLR